MRLANHDGRLGLVTDGGVIDVATASGGRFGPDPQGVYAAWADFRAWASGAGGAATAPLDEKALGPVVPRPQQVFAVGLNYLDHAAESKLQPPAQPMIFTKFASCLHPPYGEITLPSTSVDWEVELVVVIGERAANVRPEDAWQHVAGLTAGQDLSERDLQMRGAPPQFSLAKSYPGFGPIGPVLVTPDELPDPDALALTCTINGEVVQDGNSRDMVFPVPEVISYLSGVCPLLPGDLIFTGTPAGVGIGRTPPRYLAPGDVLETTISGIGTMRHHTTTRS